MKLPKTSRTRCENRSTWSVSIQGADPLHFCTIHAQLVCSKLPLMTTHFHAVKLNSEKQDDCDFVVTLKHKETQT